MRLMVVIALVINVFLALSLVFFQATRKTYPGFGLWTTGVSLLGLGSLSLCLRGSVPDSISILVVNAAFPLGMVLQLNGMRRFLGLTLMSRLWYVLPVVVLAAAAVFYYGHDSEGWRTLILSTAISAPHFAMAFLILRHPVRPRSMFYSVIASLLALGGVMVLGRGVWSLCQPQFHFFLDSPVQLIFFVSVVVLQLGESLAFMMLNSERVESELVEAEAELRKTVDGLQKALAEQKRVEESLRESEERYRTFFDTSRDFVFMTTVDGRFIDFNEVALEMLGYSSSDRQEMMGKEVASIYANHEEREVHITRIAEIGFSKQYPADLRKKDGTIIHTLITTVARKDPHGKIIGFQGTVRDITERKQAQKALKQSEQRLNRILSAATDGFWDWNLVTGNIWRSPGWTTILGYSLEETEPDLGAWDRLVHRDDLPRIMKAINDHLTGLTPGYSNEYRILTKPGEWVWIQDRGKVVERDDGGKPLRVAGAFHDITDRKQAEIELQESEEKFRSLFESSLDGILLTAPDGKVFNANPAACKILGGSEEDLREIGRDGVVDHNDPRLPSALEERSRTGRFTGELNFRRKDGTVFPAEISSAIFRTANGLLRANIVVRDITERKRAEEALRASEEKYRAVFDNAGIGIDLLDRDGRIIQANQALLDILGYSEEELHQLTFLDITHPEEKEISKLNLEALMAGEIEFYRLEKRYLRKDRSILWADLTTSALRGPNGEHSGTIGVISDITNRKKAEQEREQLRNQLAQAQKMEAIGTLTGGIAHDFNNLLTVILGYSEMLLLDRDEKDPAYDDLQKIIQTARSGAEMVQRLLVFSRKAETSPVPLDLNRQVRNTERLLSRTLPKMIRIEMRLADDLGPVRADPAQMDQIVMNLAINAKEAMPDGGTLTLETSNVKLVSDFCARHPGVAPGDYVLLSISDTGRGMDKEIQDRMFDPFFTVKGWDSRKGTGLGLPVVLGIVQHHGGCIECLSEVGKGTTFNIYLPKFTAEPLSDQADSRDVPVLGTETILLVDDEDLVRELGERILTKAGYRALTARNGREALDIYKQYQPDIALVILDLIMPEMSGKECLRELVKIDPQVRVIVSSGHSDSDDPHEFVWASVKKPYRVRQLLETVRSALDA